MIDLHQKLKEPHKPPSCISELGLGAVWNILFQGLGDVWATIHAPKVGEEGAIVGEANGLFLDRRGPISKIGGHLPDVFACKTGVEQQVGNVSDDVIRRSLIGSDKKQIHLATEIFNLRRYLGRLETARSFEYLIIR